MRITANRGKDNYGIKHFLITSDEEVANLPTYMAIGSSATNPGSGNTWTFNGETWVSSTAPSAIGTLDDYYEITDEEIQEICQ